MGGEIRPVAETITTSNREELRCARRVITLRGDCSQRIRQSEADMAEAPDTRAEDAATLLVEDHRKVKKMAQFDLAVDGGAA